MNNKRLIVAVIVVLFLVFARILPHPLNFTPVGAMALLLGSKFKKGYFGIVLVIVSYVISDVFVNGLLYNSWSVNYFLKPTTWIFYSIFMLYFVAGKYIVRGNKTVTIAGASILSSILFFVLSNLLVFLSSSLYPKTISGLVQCYTLAIPFFNNTIAGDLVFSALFFGIFSLAKNYFLVLKLEE